MMLKRIGRFVRAFLALPPARVVVRKRQRLMLPSRSIAVALRGRRFR